MHRGPRSRPRDVRNKDPGATLSASMPAFELVVVALLAIGILVTALVSLVRRRGPATGLDRSWGLDSRTDREGRAMNAWWGSVAPEGGLDADTWSDLELDGVLAWADRTLTALGAQTLYSWLRAPDRTLSRAAGRLRLSETLSADVDVRTRVQARLVRLGDRIGWDVGAALDRPAAELPLPLSGYRALALGLCVALGAAALAPSPLTIGVAVSLATVNAVIAVLASKRLDADMPTLHDLRALCTAAAEVHGLCPASVRERDGLAADVESARRASRRGGIALAAPRGGGDVLDSLLEYGRMFFLAEARGYLRMTQALAGERSAIRRALGFLGEIDAALSLAHVRLHEPDWVEPRLLSGPPRVEARELRHPAVEDAVPNDVTLGSPGLLVTGSNMSGKSTFLRTVGVGVVLAQSLGVVPAASFALSDLRVASSMGAEDDLADSVSLYQAEVLRLRELLDRGDPALPTLFLLDEVFRGTNPRDRLAASSAVLWGLSETDLVVATTHDLQLVETAGRPFALGHFAEVLDGESVVFDYRLREGVSSQSNALALLDRLGYPPAVVDRARSVRASLSD